jgi:hypothetical protein
MWVYYSSHACVDNSSSCISGTVGDRLAAAALVGAAAYATNAGSEHSLTAHRLDLNRQSGISLPPSSEAPAAGSVRRTLHQVLWQLELGSYEAANETDLTNSGDAVKSVCANFIVETGHLPSWPRIEIRRPCNSSNQTWSTVPALPSVKMTALPTSSPCA